MPTHAYTDCEISVRQPTRIYKEFPRIYNAGQSKKTMLKCFAILLMEEIMQ